MPHKPASPALMLRREWPLLLTFGVAAAGLAGKSTIGGLLDYPAAVVVLLVTLCGVILLGSLAIVRHAEVLAHRLGEPGGTLLLTLSITGLEAAMVGLVMSTGEEKPALARDTMYAVVMLVLNGYLGAALVLGGMRHRLQPYNPDSAPSFLVTIIPFAMLSLVLPSFTKSSAGPTLSTFQMAFLSAASVATYAIFLLAQNRWHRDFFIHEPASDQGTPHASAPAAEEMPHEKAHAHGESAAPTVVHVVLLALYGLGVILVAKVMSGPLDALVVKLGAPAALAGFVMAMLVLTPESIAAVNAARRNELQRTVNILLGSVLASIGLTVPIVVASSLLTGRGLVLGLGPVPMVMLVATLLVSMLTFSRPRTNVLLGAVHLMLFAASLVLIFDR